MKKKLKLAAIGLLAAALMVGCSEEEAAKVDKPEKPVEVEKPAATPTIEAGTVYGTLDTTSLKETANSMYMDEKNNVLYLMAGEEIFQVEINFDSALGLNAELDRQFLMDHALDYMAEDATLTQTVSDKEFVYESASLGKSYTVTFSGEEAITRVIVSQQ